MGLLDDVGSARGLFTLVLLLAGTVLAAVAVPYRRIELPAAAAAAAGVSGWMLSKSTTPVLFAVTSNLGVHVADLLCLPALVLVAYLSWRAVHR